MRVNIRQLKESDAYTSVKWRNIPDLWVYTTFHVTKEIKIKDELNWIRAAINERDSERFAVIVDGVYVGNTYLTNIKRGLGNYHIFIGDKRYWGKGVARKASVLTIEYAKATLDLNTIRLTVKRENAAALHLYKSLGFTETGEEDGFVVMYLELGEWDGDPRDRIK